MFAALRRLCQLAVAERNTQLNRGRHSVRPDSRKGLSLMSRITRVLLPAVFIIALCGVATSSAFATEDPFYKVEGVRLNAKETKEVGLKGGTQILVNKTSGITITCTSVVAVAGATIIGSAAGEPGTSSGQLEYAGCNVAGNGAGCAVPGKTIKTNALKDELELSTEAFTEGTTKIYNLIKPVTGAIFATIKFEGAECKFKEWWLEGTLDVEVQNSKKEAVGPAKNEKEELSGFIVSLPNGTKDCKLKEGKLDKCVTSSLKAFGTAATLEGNAEVFLTGADKGKKFGVFSK
jgi:hypothetical protein